MSVDAILEVIEQVLLSRQLSPIERFVLLQSWNGYTYNQMAEHSAYGIAHIKEVGSQLWHNLSNAVGEKVTKKNLHLILNQYQPSTDLQSSRSQQHFPTDIMAEDTFPSLLAKTKIEFPSAPLPPNSPLYINRPPIEELTYREVTQPGCVVRIRAPRLMGKSSLLNQIIARAKDFNYKTVDLDFQEADETIFLTVDKFLRWFCSNVSRRLNLKPMLDEYWDEEMGSKVSCKIYFEEYILEQIESPLVLALNEVQRVFEHPNIAHEFLPMLRFWHEQARTVETWQKLRLLLVHSTEIYIPLKLNQSPFNVGLAINLPQFTLKQVQELAVRYGLDWVASEEGAQHIASLVEMLGGHPYLVNVALYYLHRGAMSLEELLQTAPTQAGIYSHHLRSHWVMLQEEPQLISALQQVVNAEQSVELEAIAAYKLESMGLVKLEGNQARPLCQLYRLYFREQLKAETLQPASSESSEPKFKPSQKLGSENLDKLTQLPNRKFFDDCLATQWQEGEKKTPILSLILCEIDYFKFYNDGYGYAAGDATLQRIAKIIHDSVKHPDAVVARYGGTMFAALLPQINANIAIAIAQSIGESVKALAITHERLNFDGFPAPVITVSLGVATMIPSLQASPTILTSAAQEALEQSKREGHDRVTLYQQAVGKPK
jgi:diguanylate cyclase (GGDEF)-like protein